MLFFFPDCILSTKALFPFMMANKSEALHTFAQQGEIDIAITQHLNKPWIENFQTVVIHPVSKSVWQENQSWFGDGMTIVRQLQSGETREQTWYVPTLDFWELHVKVSHHNGVDCNPDNHKKYLLGDELDYGHLTTNGTLIVQTAEDFDTECEYFDDLKERIQSVGKKPVFS